MAEPRWGHICLTPEPELPVLTNPATELFLKCLANVTSEITFYNVVQGFNEIIYFNCLVITLVLSLETSRGLDSIFQLVLQTLDSEVRPPRWPAMWRQAEDLTSLYRSFLHHEIDTVTVTASWRSLGGLNETIRAKLTEGTKSYYYSNDMAFYGENYLLWCPENSRIYKGLRIYACIFAFYLNFFIFTAFL